jgi:hypothetical protein
MRERGSSEICAIDQDYFVFSPDLRLIVHESGNGRAGLHHRGDANVWRLVRTMKLGGA